MTPEVVTTVGHEALYMILLLAAPLLLSALGVGLLIGVFQAATQINEMTLSFIPKLIAIVAVIYLGGPWLLRAMTSYTERLISNIPYLIG